MRQQLPYLLVGIDHEGESVEKQCYTLEQARRIGQACMTPDPEYPNTEWRSWATWGNHPITEEWMPLEESSPENRGHGKRAATGASLEMLSDTFNVCA